MKTKVYTVDPDHPDEKMMAEAGQLIRSGKLVAFPTETVYGLGANALDPEAIARIFEAKGRPQDNPLILHLSAQSEIDRFVSDIPAIARDLMSRFWPGPLTLVLHRSALVPDVLTAGLDTVAVRVPAHPVARALIRAAGVPVAAPSANLSGKPSPTQAKHVIRDLSGRVDLVLEGGDSRIGLESTVLDLTTEPPTLLRPGGVTLEMLQEILEEVQEHAVVRETQSKIVEAPAPGMKYRHYAPEAKLILVEGEAELVRAKMLALASELNLEGKQVGAITSFARPMPGVQFHKIAGGTEEEMAHNLFRIFREFNEEAIDIILAEGIPGNGLGLAIMNRLKKASYKVIKV